MKLGRGSTALGSLLLFVVGILHGRRFSQLDEMIRANKVQAPLDGVVRASWWIFSCEMMSVAVIALLASMIPRGARIVLLCAVVMALNGALLLKFVGVFSGVYITFCVMVLFLAGALLQNKETAAS